MPMKTYDKFCKDCLDELTDENTYKYDIDKSQYICKQCSKLRNKIRYSERKEIIREQQRLHDLSIKIKIIEGYGGKCCCCKNNNFEFLTIVCKNKEKLSGKLYRYLIKNNYPKDNYDLLCYNCSNSIHTYGYCPHDKSNLSGI